MRNKKLLSKFLTKKQETRIVIKHNRAYSKKRKKNKERKIENKKQKTENMNVIRQTLNSPQDTQTLSLSQGYFNLNTHINKE